MNDLFDPPLITLAEDTRPLLAAVRAGLSDLLGGGPDAVGRCAARAPVDAAVRLAGAWAAAAAGGLSTGRLLRTLPPEDRLLVELVTAVSGGRSAAERWTYPPGSRNPSAMHADEWDRCTDLGRMGELLAAADPGHGSKSHDYTGRNATVLFIASLSRDLWPLIVDPARRRAVEATELYYTGQIPNDDYAAAIFAVSWPPRFANELPRPRTAQEYAEAVPRELDVHDSHDFADSIVIARDYAAEAVRRSPRVPKAAGYLRPLDGADEVLSARLRCLAGNPFRPAAFDPAWRTATVTALAAGVLAARDFGRLPVLADALEDAGCDDADLLAHARGPGRHVFGCRVVSACLGHGPL